MRFFRFKNLNLSLIFFHLGIFSCYILLSPSGLSKIFSKLFKLSKLFKNEMYIVRSNHDIIDDIEDATDDDEIPTFDENAAKRLK